MKKLVMAAVLVLLTFTAAVAANTAVVVNNGSYALEREIRHELLMLPYYSVFDNLQFRVDGPTVVLMGQVTRPALKEDAERIVKGIEGVDRVQNDIQVLPLSPVDDQIRIAAFRAIYGTDALSRYAHQAIAPIHIIVENGRITLEGVVASEADKNLAYLKALDVPGVFTVANHLKIE